MSRRFTLPGLLLFVGLLVVLGLLALFSRDNARAQGGQDTPTPLLTPVLTQTIPTVTPDVLRITVDPATSLHSFGPHDTFVLHFSQPMNPESVLSALIIEPTMVGQETWSDYRQTLTFTPEIGYAADMTYTIRLHPDLLMADGAKLGGTLVWMLRTVSGPPVPSLVAPEWAIGNRQPSVYLTFDRLMDEASVAAAISVTPTIPLHMAWITQTLIITPAYALTPGQTYTFQLNQTATDQDGLPLNNPFGWEIHMPATLKDTSHLYDVDKGEAIVAYFNYPVDPASFNLTSNPLLTGNLSWNKTQTVFSYTLTTRPVGNSQYILTLEQGLRDPQGGSLPLPHTLYTMKTANRISLVTPTKGNQEVSTIAPITIQFTLPMDQASVAAAFQITPPISGTITWKDNLFTFQPNAGRLAGDTYYTVSVKNSALDAEGYPIQSAIYSWQFTTATDEALVGFGDGSHNQVMNRRGRRAVQYSFPYGQQPLPVHFDLYHLSLEQWLAEQSGTFVQSWDESPTPMSETYVHVQETVLPETLSPSIYQLDISTAGRKEDSLTLILSDWVLLAQNDGQEWLFWLTTLDGVNVANTELRLYDENDRLLISGQTDAEGLWRIDFNQLPATPKRLIALSGDEMTLLDLYGPWNYQSRYAEIAPYLGLIYSDMPVYNPGQAIHFRGIVRHQDAAAMNLIPAGTTVTVELLHSAAEYGFDYEPMTSQTLTTNDFGSVNGSFTLGSAAATGHYLLRLHIGEQTFAHHLMVQPTPPSTAQLTFTTDAPIYPDGDTVKLTLSLRDAQGQPIANQLIETQIYLWVGDNTCWGQLGHNGYWGRYWEEDHEYRTDAEGRIKFSRPAEMEYDSHNGPANSVHTTWAITAQTTIAGETVQQMVVWEVSNVAEMVALSTGDNQLKNVGQAFPVSASLYDLQMEPLRGRELTLTLFAYDTAANSYSTPVQINTLVTGEDGRVSLPYTVNQPGQYRLEVSGRMANGYTTSTSQNLIIYDPAFTGSYGLNYLTISPDRTTYAPGETARFLVFTPFNGSALLTISQNQQMENRLIQLTAPLTLVDVPLTAPHQSDVYITVNAWQRTDEQLTSDYFSYSSLSDGQLRWANGHVRVEDPARQLQVTVTPADTVLTPGTPATFTVRVTNGAGEPVSAELSLSLLDATLFANHADHTDIIQQVFRHTTPNMLSGYDSLRPRRDLTWNGGFGGCGCGGDWFEPTNLVAPVTAEGIWLPSLTTDANGEATVTLTLPAHSTTWRLTAIATTADTQVGYDVLVVGGD